MKLHSELMFERRRGSIALRWDFHSWGIGVHGGAYLADWIIVGIDEYYRVTWVKFSLGPFDLELAYYGPGRKWEEEEEEKWIPLRDLRPGAIFEFVGGIKAIKTAYYHANGDSDCYRLCDGYREYYSCSNGSMIRELSEGEWAE